MQSQSGPMMVLITEPMTVLTQSDPLSLYLVLTFQTHIADPQTNLVDLDDQASNDSLASPSHIKSPPWKFHPSNFDILPVHLFNLDLTNVSVEESD